MSDCRPVQVAALLWTSKKRCDYAINPKRPTWRCKAAPTWVFMWEEDRTEAGVPYMAVCDDHRTALIDCP